MANRFMTTARAADDWYVVCRSRELEGRPRALRLLGLPMVVFRDGAGRPAALLDRCPHRNVPLSLGRVREGEIECRYHGWRFDGEGRCRQVPGLSGESDRTGREATSFPCRELDGFVWVYGTAGEEPARAPFRFPLLEDGRYTHLRQQVDFEATVHSVAENALDVPHTAFLHRGLFRKGGAARSIEVRVRRYSDRVEAEYVGEPRPEGLVGRLLAPSGGVVEHVDRFFLPSITQVEYRLGDASHLCLTAALTPIDDFHTRMFAVASFRLPIPGFLVAPLLKPIALGILRQDAAIVREQTETIQNFGEERFASTEIDVLGPHILKLLRNAERGSREEDVEPRERVVHLQV